MASSQRRELARVEMEREIVGHAHARRRPPVEWDDSKSEHGPLIAEAIGVDAIREKCPAFDEWIRTMQAWGMNPSDF